MVKNPYNAALTIPMTSLVRQAVTTITAVPAIARSAPMP